MHHSAVVIAVLSVMLVLSVFSSSMFLFVQGVIDGGISCSPQGGGKTYCCASVYDKNDPYSIATTYCTTCDDTNPPSNCTPREKPAAIVNPGRDLSNILEGGVLEQPTTPPSRGPAGPLKEGGVLEQPTTPQFGQSLGPNFGEFLQNENNMTFSQANITSNDSIASEQSDLANSGQSDDDQEDENEDEENGDETDDEKDE